MTSLSGHAERAMSARTCPLWGKQAIWDSPLIFVGGGDVYEARCPDCHEVPGRLISAVSAR